jgi:Uma2 family endonuclease
MAPNRRPMELAEFLKLPETKPALEYVDGMVTQKVSPKLRHSILQGELIERINRFARPRRLALAFPELRATFAGESPVPNIAVLRWERIPYDDRGLAVDDLFAAPDIAIEIVSPDQSTNGLIRRCVWYVSHGVQVALLADPDDESVLAFRDGQPVRVLRGAERIDLDEVLPGFALTVEEWFGVLRMR